jgi:uncharacterized protein
MQVLPVANAKNVPDDIDRRLLLSDETVAGGCSASRRVNRGTRFRLVDVEGDACVSLLLFNAENTAERLNIADTIKVQWNGYLTTNSLLLSDMGRVLASIVGDTSQTHDGFCGASNAASYVRKFNDDGIARVHTNARDRLLMACAKFGLGTRDVHPCVNFFKGVRIASDGSTVADVGPFASGRSVTMRAEMDLIIALANCPHVLDQRSESNATPLRILTWQGEPAPADDQIRNSAPERLRAYLNTDDYFQR